MKGETVAQNDPNSQDDTADSTITGLEPDRAGKIKNIEPAQVGMIGKAKSASAEAPIVFDQLAASMFSLTNGNGHPNTSVFNERFRNLDALLWNVKVLGAELAHKYYGDVRVTRMPQRSDAFKLGWKAVRFEDFLQNWFIEACSRLHLAPILHRKLWEEMFVVNSLAQSGVLVPGKRGIVFGVGQERLPSYFASLGVTILATDLDPAASSAQGWIETAQHGSLEKIFHGDLVARDQFNRLVTFEFADMNNIPSKWDGQFDFCWSVCAFEHLGSIENGLRFVEKTGQLLKPGGVSVHTTEFNYASNDETIDNWGTVLFRRKDLETLAGRLVTKGYAIPSIDFDIGDTPVDFFVDVPPYPHDKHYWQPNLSALHLKLMVDGFPTTCFGLVFSRMS
ncbi:MAG: class I SAM-dependent methyltransferase [Nitrospira sp.]|nr:class I SAM-dependent methyltransferase [Nitrospira sp.]